MGEWSEPSPGAGRGQLAFPGVSPRREREKSIPWRTFQSLIVMASATRRYAGAFDVQATMAMAFAHMLPRIAAV
jgi:hypothetical protein